MSMMCDLSEFTPTIEMDMDNVYKSLSPKNIDEYESKNSDVKIKDSPLLLKRFMLKT